MLAKDRSAKPAWVGSNRRLQWQSHAFGALDLHDAGVVNGDLHDAKAQCRDVFLHNLQPGGQGPS